MSAALATISAMSLATARKVNPALNSEGVMLRPVAPRRKRKSSPAVVLLVRPGTKLSLNNIELTHFETRQAQIGAIAPLSATLRSGVATGVPGRFVVVASISVVMKPLHRDGSAAFSLAILRGISEFVVKI